MTSIFDNFTNLYSLNKTLRFELKPIGNTQNMLEDNKVFKKDELIQKKYEKTKPYFDRLHREFITEALKNVTLSNLPEYFEIFKKWKTDRKTYVKELQAKEIVIRKGVVSFFDIQAIKWADRYTGLKNNDLGILFEEGVFAILKERYGNEAGAEVIDESTGDSISIFDSWKGFTGYFKKFFETRKNFYKDDGTSTAISTRIVDQNLKRFCDNLLLFLNIKEKLSFDEIEKTFDMTLLQFFSLNFYNNCLLQDGIDYYNKIIGGETLQNGEKIKGLNELINQYRQNNKDQKISFFKLLDKQILSEKTNFIDEIKNDTELLDALHKFVKIAEEKTTIAKNLFFDFVENNSKYDLAQVYISKEAFNTISNKWTNETDTFVKYLYEAMKHEKLAKYEKTDNSYKFPDFIALSYIKSALLSITFEENLWKARYFIDKDDKNNEGFLTGNEAIWQQFLQIFQYEFTGLFYKTINKNTKTEKIVGYDSYKKDFDDLISRNNFSVNKDSKVTIKEFADSVLTIYQMAKYFAVEKKRAWVEEYKLDSLFYTNPELGYLAFYTNAYEDIVQTYNKIRNYLTQKPYSEKKWKLNFENSSLLSGWPDSPEGNTQYSSFIFKNGNQYYLGITDYSKIFDQNKHPEAYIKDNAGYEKMVYKQVDAKTLYGSVYIGIFGTKYSEDKEKLSDRELLLRMKRVLETRVKYFPEFSNFIKKIGRNGYENAKSLARDISAGAFYNIYFISISKDYLELGIYNIGIDKYGNDKKKKLYLFKIHNKDWNLDKAKDGKLKTTAKNLHTLYFESLFSNDNIAQNFPIKLNGQAEIFYRPKTKDGKLESKKDRSGKEMIDHKRYSENKIFFHVPLALNRTKSSLYNFNSQINNFLANNRDINIIGVDRGEKHLAYYSVITQAENILESGSLNFIKSRDSKGEIILRNGKRIEEIRNDQNEIIDYRIVETGEKVKAEDYKLLLEYKEKKREIQRQTWSEVENIKDLKKGYISQVVRKLADLAIEHNAIIVLEDLNMRFKQVRGGLKEKSIYQQLEKALIDKLSFLVDKGEKDPDQAGHLLRAHQLCAPFTSFQEMGKQTGIVFYTQASYTSKIDPVTGWRPHLYLKYTNAEKAKKEILNFSKIEFIKGRFEFTYDIKNFRDQKDYPKNTIWAVCSNVERYRWNKHLNSKKGGYNHFENVTVNLKELFKKYNINFEHGILKQIRTFETKGNEKFFEDFIFYFNLICQIRNTNDTDKSKEEGKDDFILSPVEPFFDSRDPKKFGNNFPTNGDDNGAYNIARKGIIILEKLKEHSKTDPEFRKYPDLFISNSDWDGYLNKTCS